MDRGKGMTFLFHMINIPLAAYALRQIIDLIKFSPKPYDADTLKTYNFLSS